MNPGKFGGFLIANLLFSIWVGWLLDNWTGMQPLWMIVMVLYAVIGSFVILLWKKKK